MFIIIRKEISTLSGHQEIYAGFITKGQLERSMILIGQYQRYQSDIEMLDSYKVVCFDLGPDYKY